VGYDRLPVQPAHWPRSIFIERKAPPSRVPLAGSLAVSVCVCGQSRRISRQLWYARGQVSRVPRRILHIGVAFVLGVG
jgi:hypothetical protein